MKHNPTACQYSILKTIKMYNHARNQCSHDSISGRIATIRSAQENNAVLNLFIATYGHGIDVSTEEHYRELMKHEIKKLAFFD